MRWWLRPTTTSTTSPRGESASNSIPVFANAIRSLGGGDKSPTWHLFFKVTPYELAAPVLGNELEAMRRWVQLLAKGGEPALAAYKKPLEKLIAEADAAMKARTDAALANEHFRTKGGLAEFFTDRSKQRVRSGPRSASVSRAWRIRMARLKRCSSPSSMTNVR